MATFASARSFKAVLACCERFEAETVDDSADTFGTSAAPTVARSQPFSSEGSGLAGLTRPGRTDLGAAGLNRADLVSSREGGDRSGVFERLVQGDADIAGLVAYSLYKQNKLDWLRAFEAAKGRPPQDMELASYIIGEATPRRLATYRHLAEATLAGHGPDMDMTGVGSPKAGGARPVAIVDRASLKLGLLATYGLIAVLFVVGFWLAAHYTMSSR